jgi:hypothetical protein
MDGPNAMSPDSPEFKKQITEVVGGQIRKQVELLAPVLDPGQKQRYHDLLVSKKHHGRGPFLTEMNLCCRDTQQDSITSLDDVLDLPLHVARQFAVLLCLLPLARNRIMLV